jgi:Calx-beta domain
MFFLPLTAVVPADARTAVVARPFSTHQILAPTLDVINFCVVSLAELVAVPPRRGGARRISISDVTKREGRKGTTLFTFTVTLSAAYDQAVTMSYRTVDGTATTSDSDYIAKTGTLTFAAGETTKTITIEVKGDSKREADEIFYLDLFDNSSNSLFTKNRGLGTILNDA